MRAFVLVCGLASISVAQAPPSHLWFDAPLMLDTVQGDIRHVGDLDGDGDLDAVAFFGLVSMTPLLNDGFGHLSLGTTVPQPAFAGPISGLLDIDGDSFADLLTTRLNTSPSGPALLIHFGTGAGTFAPPIERSLPGNVAQLLTGDADGDVVGDVFLMHFGAAGSVVESRWLHGDPTRGLVLAPSTNLPFTTAAALIDVDGNGLDDLATVIDNPVGPDSVQLWVTAAVGFTFVASLPVQAGFVLQLLPIDFDVDGDRDLFAISSTGTSSSAITQLRHDAGSTWAQAGNQAISTRSTERWFAANWDGSGGAELLQRTASSQSSSSSHEFAVWRVDGAGSIARIYARSIPDQDFTHTPSGPGPCDLDRDGRLDFLGNRAVVFGDGTLVDPEGAEFNAQLDWDRDGDVDAFPRGRLGLNDGTGALVEHDLLTAPAPAGQFFGSPFYFTDLNGDGLHEMLVARFTLPTFSTPSQLIDMRLLRETPGFLFVDSGPAAAAGQAFAGRLLFDDVDGDGDTDLVARQGLWINDGHDFFALNGPSFGGYEPRQLVDIDGDGDLDFVSAKVDGGMSLAINHRTGPATYTTTVLYPSTSNALSTTAFSLADFDDDGDVDLVGTQLANPGPTRCLLFENQLGQLVQRMTIDLPGGPFTGDVDGDGRSDLGFASDRRLSVMQRTAPWTFAAPVVFGVSNCFGLVDIDQDGDLDIAALKSLRGRRFELPGAGLRRQYGNGGVGGGGHQPLLSLVGPVRPGRQPQLRLRGAPGGAPMLLLFGTGERDVPSVLLPGVTSYVDGLADFWFFMLSGTTGVPGAGALDLPVPLSATLAGIRVFLQGIVADPQVPAGVGYSNGLEVRIGS